jgi:hypothetical protein
MLITRLPYKSREGAPKIEASSTCPSKTLRKGIKQNTKYLAHKLTLWKDSRNRSQWQTAQNPDAITETNF